jgi:hypothetical protein
MGEIGRVKPGAVHLVGSVPLANANAVFRMVAGTLRPFLKRMPDGETGERSMWIAWQAKYLSEHPAFEVEAPPPGEYAPLPRCRLKGLERADELDWPNGIGYASAAITSYRTFAQLKDRGVIPRSVRFQVSLPTPVAPVAQFVSQRDQAAVEPAYERQMQSELRRICSAVPHAELAIQWDVALEMGMWEGVGGPFEPWFDPVEDGIVDRLVRCARAVPNDVELGFHLCYGDFGHEHFVEPADAGNLADISQRLTERVVRPIDWIHIPVPRGRSDAAYFAPLADLHLGPETTLYLGLIHATDGLPGAERRLAAASEAVSAFGVATECGFGRRPPGSVLSLMELHAEVAERFTTLAAV